MIVSLYKLVCQKSMRCKRETMEKPKKIYGARGGKQLTKRTYTLSCLKDWAVLKLEQVHTDVNYNEIVYVEGNNILCELSAGTCAGKTLVDIILRINLSN